MKATVMRDPVLSRLIDRGSKKYRGRCVKRGQDSNGGEMGKSSQTWKSQSQSALAVAFPTMSQLQEGEQDGKERRKRKMTSVFQRGRERRQKHDIQQRAEKTHLRRRRPGQKEDNQLHKKHAPWMHRVCDGRQRRDKDAQRRQRLAAPRAVYERRRCGHRDDGFHRQSPASKASEAVEEQLRGSMVQLWFGSMTACRGRELGSLGEVWMLLRG